MNQNQLFTTAIILGLVLAFAAVLFYFYRAAKAKYGATVDPRYADKESGLYEAGPFRGLVTASVEAFERYQAPFTLLIFNYDAKILRKMPRDERQEIIQNVGKKVRASIRQTDQAGRPSGDSIAILLCNTGGNDSKIVSKRMSAMFDKVLPDSRVQVTAWSTPDDIGLMRLYINSELAGENKG